MEAEIRKLPRGSIRMQEYERKLAADIEDRVLRKNKAAKTQSAHEPDLEPISTNTNSKPANSKPANGASTIQSSLPAASSSDNLPAPQSASLSTPSLSSGVQSQSSGVKRKPDVDISSGDGGDSRNGE